MATGRMQYFSPALNQITEFSFVLPNDLQPHERAGNPCYDRPAKTLYLLHGLTGIDTDWLWGGGCARELARDYNLNIFMPTCGNNYYIDRPGRGNEYGRFIGEEFPDYVSELFGLSPYRADTLIGGFSMGGYGTLQAAFTYPDAFSGAIALSAANPTVSADPEGRDNPIDRYEAEFYRSVFGPPEGLGDSEKNPEVRAAAAVAAGKKLPRLYLACGTEDTLIWINRRYRDRLSPLASDLRYEEGPGRHDWQFWNHYVRRGLDDLLNE